MINVIDKELHRKDNEDDDSKTDNKVVDKQPEDDNDKWECYDHLFESGPDDEDDEEHEGTVLKSPKFKKQSSIVDVLMEEAPNKEDDTNKGKKKSEARLKRAAF